LRTTLVLTALLAAASLHAQSVAGLGAVSGMVADASGAAVPAAEVTVRQARLGVAREVRTTSTGLFSVVSLPPASGYTVTAKKEGFHVYQSGEFEVRVGAAVNLRPVLSIAAIANEVTVTADAPAASVEPGVSAVVSDAQISNLPINGRRVDSFVLLAPAVSPEGTAGLLTFRGIPGGNAFLTDGNDTTNQLWNENGGRTRISSNISQDAVQEFQVLANNYSAEFGRAVGGVINTVTRSGSNDTHGTAYWFFRNQDFNARDGYAATNPEERRNQAGGTVGGAIARDRLFYFVNGEVTRRAFPIVSSMTRPPLFDASGRFVGACTASAAQCSAASNSFSRFNAVVDRRADSATGLAKLDYRAGRNQVSASFNAMNWNSPNGLQTVAVSTTGSAFGSNGNSEVKTRFARLAWTGIATPATVNEFRFGWFKDRLVDTVSPELLPPTGVATITVQGVSNLGSSNSIPRVYPTEDRFQFADSVSLTRGRHLLKAGVDISHVRDVQDQVFQGNGVYTYATFSDFALDFSGNGAGEKRWQQYTQAFGPSLVDTWIRDYAFFAQDQFHVTPRLTLNAGLRYEIARYSQPAISNPDFPETARIPEPSRNAGPRFGFAYSMFDGRTALRGGYGVFHARTPASLVNWLTRDNSVFQYTITLQGNNTADRAAGPVFPNRLPALNRTPPAGSTSVTFASDEFRTPYVQQGDLTLEQQARRDLTVSASWIWSRGVAFTTIRDRNMGALGAPVTYTILNSAGAPAGTYTTATYLAANRVNPRYQRIGALESGGNTWYNGLALQARKRAGRWWEGSASYTWSHALDNNLGVTGDNLSYGSTPRTVYNGDFAGEKGTSELDRRHRFVCNTVFHLKFGLKGSWALAHLVDDWQLSQITTLSSGARVTPTVTVSGAQFTGQAFNTTLNGLGGATRVPFLQRQSLPLDPIRQVDARIAKVIAIKERVRMMAMFEAFNLSNSQYNTSVQSQAYSASRMVLTPTARLGEGSASAGFPDGTNARRLQFGLRFAF